MKKKFLKCCRSVMMVSVGCIAFVACSDDKEEPTEAEESIPGIVNPSNVFTGVVPKRVGDLSITRNSEGLVTEMETTDGRIIRFDYLYTRATVLENHVTMSVIENDLITDYDLSIGYNGFITKAYVKIGDPDSKDYEEGTWSLFYDEEGHLTKATHRYVDIQGTGDYSVNLLWQNGNLMKTWKDGEDGDWDSYSYQYTSEAYPTPVENRGSLFMFEDIYPVEVYEFEWLYYAGMLGKGPEYLAVSCYENDEEEIFMTNFMWTLNESGYPTMFDVRDDDHPGSSTVRFVW